MTPYDKVLQQALGKGKNTIAGLTSVDINAKGLALAGAIEIRMEEELLPDEDAAGIADKAAAAALRRIEDIIDGIISGDVLDKQFFTSVTRTKAKGSVDIPIKIAGLQGANGKFISALNLSRIINIGLFRHVKKEMVAPALVYRSGRFAHSAHVTQITGTKDKTSKSRGSVFFSYMLKPYSVFEGHETRDPATLIRTAISKALKEALSKSSYETTNFSIIEDK